MKIKGQAIMGIIAAVIVIVFLLSFWGWWNCILGNPSDSSVCNGYIGLWAGTMIVGILLGVFTIR